MAQFWWNSSCILPVISLQISNGSLGFTRWTDSTSFSHLYRLTILSDEHPRLTTPTLKITMVRSPFATVLFSSRSDAN